MSIINLSKQKNRFTQKQKYTFLGVTMGFLFPIVGTLFECSFRNMGYSFYQFIECQKSSPALWLVDMAPLFLGLVASFAGRQLDLVNEKNKQIEDRYKQMSELREIADNANKGKSEFLANMSHEIRTPMNAILGMNYLISKTSLDEKQRDFNNKIETSAKSLLRIIDDILDFSKIEAGKLTLEVTHLYLEELIADIAATVNIKLHKKPEVELVTYIDPKIPPVLMGDSLRLRQVLLNLTDNAAKFTEKGEIKIEVTAVQKMSYGAILRFSVKDSGIGLTEEAVRNLFQPFHQADVSTTRKYGGTGLGLAICRNIVHLMDGELSVKSKTGQGSEFIFNAYFSLEDNMDNQIETIENIKGLNALLVDDSESARMVLNDMLMSLGFEVTIAKNGAEAIEKFDNHINKDPFSLLVVDWQMPGMDGLELVNELKKQHEGQIPAVLMVTAYGLDTVRKAARDHEVDGLIIKPVNPSALFDSVNRILQLGKKKLAAHKLNKQNDTNHKSVLEGKRILLVEDNEINMELAMELLKDVGILYDSAWNGEEAIEKLKESNFDLVLMDIQMPVMDGLTAARKIREELNNKELPVIAMTAHAMKGEREKSLAAGMNDHITKPIDPEFLYLTLRKFLVPQSIIEQPQFNTKDEVITESIINNINITGIDTITGLRRAAGKEEVYLKLLKTFVENYGNFKAKTGQLHAQNRLDETGMLLHTLAGVSGNIGITEVYKLTQQLSMEFKVHIKGGSMNFTPILQYKLEEVANVLEIYLDRIHVFLASLEKNSITSKIEVSDVELDEMLNKLGIGIAENDPVSIEQCNYLIENIKINDSLVELLVDVSNSINNFDFDEAMEKFNSLKTK
jgi:signal transduction histidine kinase/DNA-binding response OmpR family regulator/HPt (histidine-containing phosphotransfer) domain-containing protein